MTDEPHVPVLKDEILGWLEPGPGQRIVDGTFGYGGHTAALLEAGAEVLGLDLDTRAVATCRRISADRPRLHCAHASFGDWVDAAAAVGWKVVDGLLLDLGVSSPQLDEPERGFSYRGEGPLDLRFDPTRGEPAHALVARWTEAELARTIREFGEDRGARPIARAIKAAARNEPLRTTRQLTETVEAALPPGAPRAAVLSRVFQALRIAVNDELGTLRAALAATARGMAPGGKIVVVAYHSLEDRIVKQYFVRESRDCICPPQLPECRCGHRRSLKVLTRGAQRPGAEETARNPRSRSARLRAAERTVDRK